MNAIGGKTTREDNLREFTAEIGLLCRDLIQKTIYPDWEDAIVPVMGVLPGLGSHAATPECHESLRQEVDALVSQFADVLSRLGFCTAVSHDHEADEGHDYLQFEFSFRDHVWWCVVRKDEVWWKHRRPRKRNFLSLMPSSSNPQPMQASQVHQAMVLVKYLLDSAETSLAGRAARRRA